MDGLRAIAIISVVVFHTFPQWAQGGFIGVDVFFVISGFLISGIIFGNLEKSSFSYAEFYARRIRRIFPALTLVLIASIIIGWFVFLPDEYGQLGKHIAGGGGFVSNLVTWGEAGYFDAASENKPLLHLWSLGIEEQFYIFWPLLLGLVWRYRLNFFTITFLIALASFSVNIYDMSSNQTADFYSPLSRCWELMIGGVLAYLMLHKKKYLPKNTNWNSIIGLILIIIAVVSIKPTERYPGWLALLPTLGTFLIISAQPTALVNRYLLGNRVMVAIGLISYPLYLWHWPLLVFARIANFGTPLSTGVRTVIVILSFILAGLTYLFLEKPIRRFSPMHRSAPLLAGVMFLITVSGVVIFLQGGVPSRFTDALRPYLTFVSQYDFKDDARAGSCWVSSSVAPDGYSKVCVDPPAQGKRLVVVWGDSHAARFYAGLKAIDGGRSRFAQFTRDSCAPILNRGYDECIKANTFVYGEIKVLKPDVVILDAVWQRYEFVRRSSDTGILSTIASLRALGCKTIIFMGPDPEWQGSMPNDLVRQELIDRTNQIPVRTFRHLLPTARGVDLILHRELSNLPGVTYFSPYGALCNASGCLTTVDGKADGLTTWDYGHLSTLGAMYVAKKLIATTPYFGAH